MTTASGHIDKIQPNKQPWVLPSEFGDFFSFLRTIPCEIT